ncbi:histidinol-phosphatase [Pseudomonas sp. BN411]|uniref:histidinol-phosphatase n=1 Tax=Pseudomonas sp. BN411 TaxID=2567887 RepID=UPI002457E955|nr:histidinol-phosphatase [Pseudomonas sp. BN411]
MPMNDQTLPPDYLEFAEELADAAAKVTLTYFRLPLEVENKEAERFDPVTLADKGAERAMRDLIAQRFPGHGVLGEEEENIAGEEPWTWVLDPVDGTRSFISGIPLWGTLIALNDGTRPALGVMDQPFTRERFIGDGSTASLNGRPIQTRACRNLADATLMVTSPEHFQKPPYSDVFSKLSSDVRLVRYSGDCYAYCMLALGLVDIVLDPGLKPYDIQALMPIIQGAGGVVTRWDGGDAQNGGDVIACGDPRLHAQILELMQSV